jgi:nucleoside-diphosphate-sugar epimerase
MDFQRTLESMESQVRAVYNFVELAISVHNLRPTVRPKLIFTSTIAVAARYPGTILPEETIEDPSYSAPMGYGEGKWVCEKMLENALKSHGNCFQPAILRLGQMTGTTTTGHWAKDEHFPVLLKASKTVGKIPALHGTYSWLPMDVAARTVIDVTFDETNPAVVYHVENPVRQQWEELIPSLAKKLQLTNETPVPFAEWLKDVLACGAVPNLENFFSGEFEKLSGGGLVLHSKQTQSVSPNLRDFGAVGPELLDLYLDSWRKHGVI